jgi:DNA-binding winged helix-turn-helix (wHTH) protein
MDALASSEVFLFEDFRLDGRGGCLFQRAADGAFTAVAISSRGLAILRVLIERAGEVAPQESGERRQGF